MRPHPTTTAFGIGGELRGRRPRIRHLSGAARVPHEPNRRDAPRIGRIGVGSVTVAREASLPLVADNSAAKPERLSPSQQARLDRLREPASSAAFSTRLADEIDQVCDAVERAQLTAAAARDDAEMAWLVVCDRGWPRDCVAIGLDLTATFAWLAAWSELVSLPVQIATQLDKSKLRWIEERLTLCERPLRSSLPEGLWHVIGAFDQTGRATLAYVLQALVTLTETHAQATSAVVSRDQLVERLSFFRQQARKLGLRAPLSPLDLRAWRATAISVRAIRD